MQPLRKGLTIAMLASAILLSCVALANPQRNHNQRQNNQNQNTQHQNRQPMPPRIQQQRMPIRMQDQRAHSRREVVRTPSFVQRMPSNPPRLQRPTPWFQAPSKPVPLLNPRQHNARGQAFRQNHRPPVLNPPFTMDTPNRIDQRQFTRQNHQRWYDNGIRLGIGHPTTNSWERRYFHRGFFFFPHYRRNYHRTLTFISLYGFFYELCPPFIDASVVHYYPPSVTFVNIPVYSGSTFTTYQDWSDDNLLNDKNLDDEEPGLVNALDEITEAFQKGNIDALVPLCDPNANIAVYERGQYKYSLSANDYLDLTRDALNSMNTTSFSLDYLHKDAQDVYTASGTQEYRDANGLLQTMHVSFVLQSIAGEWTLTQVQNSPNQYENLSG